MTAAIETEKLTRRFSEFTVVVEISLQINSAEIFGRSRINTLFLEIKKY